MATKIKDQATAERAALKLNEGIDVPATGEPITPREKTTSEKLFPAFTTDDGGIVNRPVRNLTDTNMPVPVTETPKAEPQSQIPMTQTPPAPIYLNESELKGKMVKLKVDGIEQDVPADQLLKLNQLERHSNAQLMKLAEERAALERDRATFLSQRTQTTPEQKPTKQEPAVKKSVEVEALEARLAQMEAQIVQQNETLRPAIQEAGIKRVEQLAKDKLGADDFRFYFDKVREVAMAKAQDALSRGNQNEARMYDSDSFYYETYKDMKIKDLMAKPSVLNPTAPVLQTQQGAPIIMTNSGQPVSLPSFESSSGVPSRENPDANWQSTYNALLAKATQSGSNDDFLALYRHKMKARE